jgi:hypothetical protein
MDGSFFVPNPVPLFLINFFLAEVEKVYLSLIWDPSNGTKKKGERRANLLEGHAKQIYNDGE